MKTAIGCLALLSLLLLGAFLYSAQMAQDAEVFSKQAVALSNAKSEERSRMIDRLKEEWRSREIWFSLSVPHSELDRIQSELVHIEAAAKTEDGDELQLAAALLSDAFKHIGRLYEASLDNIL